MSKKKSKTGPPLRDYDESILKYLVTIFDERLPDFWIRFLASLYDRMLFAGIAYQTSSCVKALFESPENQNILNFIEENNFDMILSDPLDLAGPLISWKFQIPLVYNTRWGQRGDAGQKTDSYFFHF